MTNSNTLLSAWDDDVINELASFSELAEGWHYGEGGPIKAELIRAASEIYRFAKSSIGFAGTEVFPGVYGEILLSFRSGRNLLEITINPNGKMDFLWEFEGRKVQDEENLCKAEVIENLHKARQRMFNLFDTSITVTTPKENVDTRALHFHFPAMAASLLFPFYVLVTPVAMNVPMQEGIQIESSVIPSTSGISIPLIFR